MHKKTRLFQEAERKHKKQGVYVKYYSWFEVKEGVYLPSMNINKVSAWSLISFKVLDRKTRRFVEHKALGSSKFERKNTLKMKFMNLQKLITNKRKRLSKMRRLFKL